MNRTQKAELVVQLRDELAAAASVLLTDMTGLDVNTTNELRSQLRAKGVQCRVVKNTLIRRAIADTDKENVNELLAGPTVLMWHNEEPAIPAKILKDFVKELPGKKEVGVKGAWLDGDLMEGESAMTLADLPSKDELRSQFLGLLTAVPSKFLSLMQTPQKQFLGVLVAKQQKDEEAA